jgi:hypothetical protein
VRLHARGKRPKNVGRVEHVNVIVENEDVLRVIESQRSSGGPAGIAFRHLLHGDKNIVVGVPALFTNRRDTWNGFAAAAQIGSFARQIHPGLIPFRRDDRLIHGAVTIIDCSDLVLGASGVALGPEITRCLAERTLDNALVRYQHSLDDDLRVGRNQKIFAEGFRRC